MHDCRKPCAHPVGAETRQKTSPKPLVPLAETGIELRHRRARRRASRRKLRTAGSWETSRPSGPARSDAHAERDGGPAGGNSGRRGAGRPADRAARRGATRTPSETAGQPEETPDGGELGDQPTERPGEERRGPPSTRVGHRRQLRRRRPGRPGRRRAGRSGRQSRKAKQAAGQPVADDAGNRSVSGPALSHLDSTEHDHRVRRRATSDDDAAGDRGGDGTGQGVRCTPTTNVGPSGQPGGGEAGNRSADGPGGRGGGRRCDRRAGWGNPAAARRAGNRRTRRGPTDVRLHRRSTSRSGQPGRRPTGRANAGPLDLIHRGAPHHVPVCQRRRR